MKKLLLLLMLLVTSVASWAVEPYFEVIYGSFASGNVTLKITFPEATALEVGTTSLRHSDWDMAAHGYSPVAYDFYPTSEGNTMTVTFTGFSPLSGDLKYSIQSYDLKVDGVSYSAEIQSKDAMPFAEDIDGSLTSGNLSVMVTFPAANTISASLGSNYTVSLWNNDVKLSTISSNVRITAVDNTFKTTFSFTPQSSDELSSCTIKIDAMTFRIDGSYNTSVMSVSFKSNAPDPSGCAHDNLTHHDAVESTDLVQGNDAYDECDDCGACFATTDTEHATPLTAADFQLPLDESPVNYFYIQNLEGDDTEVYWIGDVALQYSYDGTNWTNSTSGDALPANGRIYYRATTRGNTAFNPGEKGFTVRTRFTYKNYAVGGDITTLIRSNGKVSTLPAPTNDYEDNPRGIFERFFNNDYYLLDASELVLPSTTLSDHCYYEMFFGCGNLTGATPTINAVTMAPYSCMNMFSGCFNITTATDLQVETMAEYSCAEMFSNCTNLQNAPAIPATTVAAHSCEYMFHDCTSMTTAPAILPATTLAEDCYKQMFYGCSNITTAPELPATSLVDGCYVQMFYGCSNLNYIKVGLMTDWPMTVTYNESEGYNEYDYPCTRQWVYGVNETGTFNGNTCLFKDIFPGPDGYTSAVPSKRYEKVFWTSENPLTVPVTISSVGYSTFCYDYNWIIPEGTEGYIAYVNDNGYFCFEKGFDAGDVVNSYRSAYQTYEDGQMIEQWVCKAVVLKGAPGTYNVQLTSRDAIGGLEESVDKNALYGSMHDFDIRLFHTLQDDNTGISNSDYYYYALSLDEDGENVGFYWMEEDGAPFVTKPYKAFLRAKKSVVGGSAKKGAFVFEEDGIVTEIERATDAERQQPAIFDLTGRSVTNAKSGLYIINGKKVVK